MLVVMLGVMLVVMQGVMLVVMHLEATHNCCAAYMQQQSFGYEAYCCISVDTAVCLWESQHAESAYCCARLSWEKLKAVQSGTIRETPSPTFCVDSRST